MTVTQSLVIYSLVIYNTLSLTYSLLPTGYLLI